MHHERKGLVSVIVPVYNTEAYLARCLDSLLNNTYKNIEIRRLIFISQRKTQLYFPLIYNEITD